MIARTHTPIEHPEALFNFTTATDRGPSGVFVGRDDELQRLDGYLRLLRNKFAEDTPAGDGHTVLFEACSGMGKTALLAQFRDRAERTGLPATQVTHRHLTSFEAFASRLKAGLDSTVRRNRNAAAVRVAKTLLPGVRVLFGEDAAEAANFAAAAIKSLSQAGRAMKRDYRPPLAITIDEAALLGKRHRDVMVEIHEAALDWPILPVLAGTYGARQALKRAGVYRLGRGRHDELECLHEQEARLAFPALCDQFGIGLESDEIERWADRIAADSSGFPQHLNIGLVSAAEELLEANEQGRAPDIERAAAQAARRRGDYYLDRLGSVLPRYGSALVAAVTAIQQSPADGAHRNAVEAAFLSAANKDRAAQGLPPLQAGEEARLIDRAVVNGVLQPALGGAVELSIPSMGDYIVRTYGEPERGGVER